MILFDLIRQPPDDPGIKIIAAQMIISGSGQHFDHAIADLDDGHIKCSAAQIIYHDFLGFSMIQTVGKSCTGGLIDDPQHIPSPYAVLQN